MVSTADWYSNRTVFWIRLLNFCFYWKIIIDSRIQYIIQLDIEGWTCWIFGLDRSSLNEDTSMLARSAGISHWPSVAMERKSWLSLERRSSISPGRYEYRLSSSSSSFSEIESMSFLRRFCLCGGGVEVVGWLSGLLIGVLRVDGWDWSLEFEDIENFRCLQVSIE